MLGPHVFAAMLAGFVLSSGVPQHRTIERIGPWRLIVTQDRFTGDSRCVIRRQALEITPTYLTLDLGAEVDTAKTIVRIDGGEPYRLDGSDETLPDRPQAMLFNPSMGLIRLPLGKVRRAQQFMVELDPRKPLRRVELGGLDQAIGAAADHCPGFATLP